MNVDTLQCHVVLGAYMHTYIIQTIPSNEIFPSQGTEGIVRMYCIVWVWHYWKKPFVGACLSFGEGGAIGVWGFNSLSTHDESSPRSSHCRKASMCTCIYIIVIDSINRDCLHDIWNYCVVLYCVVLYLCLNKPAQWVAAAFWGCLKAEILAGFFPAGMYVSMYVSCTYAYLL